MPNPITTSDPILAAVASSEGVTTAFLSDVVDLINRSPSLLTEINQLDATPLPGGGTAEIELQTGSDNGGSTYYHAPVIDIAALPSYSDASAIYAGGALAAGETETITPAGAFVGVLAHEIAHWGDPQLGPLYTPGDIDAYPIEQAVATEFASEGKAATSQYAAMAQVQASEATDPVPAGMANGNILFNVTGSPAQDSALLQHAQSLANGSSAYGAEVSYLGSQFWNVNVDGGTYLSTMWGGYSSEGARNDLGINQAQITGFQVSETEAGTLAGCTIETQPGSGPGLTYGISCPIPGQQQAQITNSATGALLATVDTVVTSAQGIMQLSLAANGYSYVVPGDAAATVQGNDDTLTLGQNAQLTLAGSGDSVTGSGANLVLSGTQNTNVAGSQDTVVLGNDPGADFALRLSGNGDQLLGAKAASDLQLTLAGTGSVVSLTSGAATIGGAGAGTTVFGGASKVDDQAGGVLVMGTGAATVSGGQAGAHQTVFGGGGGVQYQGSGEYADVIGGAGACTIRAGSGGGWYMGGQAGGNLLAASAAGTVLEAGGNGDTLVGAANGGTYLLAASGNETLNGGNRTGEASMFLGSGADVVVAGTGGSVVDTGSGHATVYGGGGDDQVWDGSGGADLFVAGHGGQLTVDGFRTGTDHLSTGGQGLETVASAGGGTLFTLSSGATVLLVGVNAQGGSVFV